MSSSPTNPPAGNLLGQETSPYLLQHRDNPVHWRAWGAAALAEAQANNKPILLSVGYAACHWCHVMAHESFEDQAVADQMNRLFVNIKVDREERPDVDALYQQALSLLGQQGGWPLTMFLTPEGRPFWGGTYFPKEPRYGRPGFPEVLDFVAATFADEPEKIAKNRDGLAEAMRRLARSKSGDAIAPEMLDQIAERLLGEVDFELGGIGTAPKFPQIPIFTMLWRAGQRDGNPDYARAVNVTLTRMMQGGIYDHLGGGLARYSTDAAWLAPHFEKMLYDNAELVGLATEVWRATDEPLLRIRVTEIVDWLAREMLAAPDDNGDRAFAASLDADSEGEEGRFYVWTNAEIDAVLGAEAAFFESAYDVTPGGNWEGHTILNRSARPQLLDTAGEARLATARAKLMERRASRVRPGWDDKVLADWNGLMIAALAEASQVFERPDWLSMARAAFAFIRGNLMQNGRLLHAWREGRAQHPATLDDHANMARAALLLHEATGDDAYLTAARDFAGLLDAHYWDRENGGYFMTADDTMDVIERPKSAADNATPNGNGTMIEVLARLWHATGADAYRARGAALERAFAGEVERNFFPLATYLNAIALTRDAAQLAIVGDRDAGDTQALLRASWQVPNEAVFRLTLSDASGLPDLHPAFGKTRIAGEATAYLCRNGACGLPMTDAAALAAALAPTTG